MNRHDVIIAGHGSGTPSVKYLDDYCKQRYNQNASNGVTKGLECVVRFLKTPDQEKAFHDNYSTLIGRNKYSQDLRQYVYTPNKNGIYYSDCSSSICHTYDRCGISGCKSYNTASMYYNGTPIPVRIVNGQIAEEDLPLLKVGDALLFRGNDPSRPKQIGHVESVFEIRGTGKWELLADGTWVYKENGKLLKNQWKVIDHHWYYFSDDCVMKTGWQMIGGKWYYLEESNNEHYQGACWRSDETGAQYRWYVE